MQCISLGTRKKAVELRDAIVAYLLPDGELATLIESGIVRMLALDAVMHHPTVYTLTWKGKLIGVFWRPGTAETIRDNLTTQFGLLRYYKEEFEIKAVVIQGPPPELP